MSDKALNSMRGRLLCALLKGVNRARPFLPNKERDGMGKKSGGGGGVEAIYCIAHSSSASPSASAQALLLLYNLTVITPQGGGGDGGDGDGGRGRGNDNQGRRSRDWFYHALYSVLSDAAMLSCKRHLTVYLNLIFKALKNDADDKDYDGVGDKRGWTRTSAAGGGRRAIAIAKRLLHTAQHAGSAPGLAAAVLMVSEASRYRPALRRALTGGKGEDENDDGGKGMGGEGGSSSLSSSYFDPSKRDQNILLDLAFLRR